MNNETNNARNKMLCDPHDGSRSSKFLKLCRDLKAAMSGQFTDKDDMDSLWRALVGTDQGGKDGRAIPGGAAKDPAERKRVRRQAAAFSMVYLHIEDERLKEMLESWTPLTIL